MQHLQAWEDIVLGEYSEQGADRVKREAEARGLAVELLTRSDYTGAYVASALGCPALASGELRVVFQPSFHPEGVVTARRTPEAWEVETRISRENLWYARFSAVPFALWSKVVRTPGTDVRAATVPLEVGAATEQRLLRSVQHPKDARSRIGADGMTVLACSRLAGAEFEEEAWCPERDTPARAAADLALLLAASSASPEWLRGIATSFA